MKTFLNKNILITGAASGIGKLMAQTLAKRGAQIIVVDLNLAEAELVAQEIKKQGGKALALYANLGEVSTLSKCKSDLSALGIRIDILINNAGIVFGGEFEKLSLEKHLLTFNVNVNGLVAMTHLFFDDLKKSSEAHIVNLASASGFIGLPYGSSYASSKWAVVGFSESLRLEVIERNLPNISVTTVCPSYISTGMFTGVKAPMLLPWLKPEVIVAKIIEGIEKKKPFVKEPFVVKYVDLLKGVLPLGIFTCANKLLGVSTSMTHWKGRNG